MKINKETGYREESAAHFEEREKNQEDNRCKRS